jgi:plastocyanin
MKKLSLVAAVVIVALAAGGGWYLVAKNHKSASSSTSTKASHRYPWDSSSSQAASQNPQATNAVTIQNFVFNPIAITVKKGTTVTWTNKDHVPHTVTETDGKTGPGSAVIAPGATYTFTFSATGTYHYHCSIYQKTTGKVTVTD